MRKCLVWVLLLLAGLLGGLPGWAAEASEAEPLPLGGIWKGKLAVPDGSQDITISIVPLAGEKYFVALDVPAQKLSRLVTELEVRGDSVLLKMPTASSRYDAYYDASRRELSGNWTQAGRKSPLKLYYFPMPKAESAGTRLAPPYHEEEVVFSNPMGRLNLAGTLTLPPGKGPFPAVVLASDLGAQDRDGTVGDYRLMGSLADYLTRRGIAVLRYDDRGVGKSGGNTSTATTAMLVSDVQAAINYLRTRLEVNIAHIGIIGHGEGANVALLTAGRPLPPAFVISMAGYGLTGQQTLLQQQVTQLRAQKLSPASVQSAYERQRTMYDIIRQTNSPQALAIVSNMLRQDQPSLDDKAVQAEATQLLTPWRQFFLSFDPIETLDQVQCPVLLLSGTSDDEAPADMHLTALEKELKSVNRAVVVKRLPGVNHLFQPPKTEWTLMNGEMRPVLSPLAQETIREWIVSQTVKK